MSNEQENLNEVLSGFYGEQEANEFKNDLISFDKMLAGNPAPSAKTVADIKNAVATELSSRQHRNRFFTFRKIAVAAIILLIALVGTNMDIRRDIYPDTPDVALAADLFDESETSQIALLTEQVEQIEDALLSVRLDEYDSYIGDSYLELETELNEINGNFWKGQENETEQTHLTGCNNFNNDFVSCRKRSGRAAKKRQKAKTKQAADQ